MSRKLLTLVLTSIFVLSFGLSAFAQNAEMKVEITGGTAPNFADTINGLNAMVGNAATYNYAITVKSVQLAGGAFQTLLLQSIRMRGL